MNLKLTWLMTLFMALVMNFSFGQEKTVTGTVTTAEDGLPLPGATVLVKGTTRGTQTDFDGQYSITVSGGETLVFSYVGTKTAEIAVGADSVIDVRLVADNALEEVIVTAQNIKREKKSLGSAIGEVDGERLQSQPTSDVGNILRGEVSGLNITSTTGNPGAAPNIIIRGFTSISLSNQPLVVVDGIPIDGSTNADQANGFGFIDNINQPSRLSDIDPNNIADVKVLKGLSAAVLYGAAGRNGVILITTKNGASPNAASKVEINVQTSTFFSDPHLPDYQNEFGGGFDQTFGFFVSNYGPSFSATDPELFGANFVGVENGQTIIRSPLRGLGDQSLLNGIDINDRYVYQPYQSVDNFFRTGVANNLSVSARGGDADASFTASFSHLTDQGFLPENNLIRNNASIGGKVKLSNKFTVSGSANFVTTRVKSPPISVSTGGNIGTFGNSSSIYSELLFTPRHIDLENLPFQAVDGRSVYYRAGNDIQNPNWTVRNARTGSDNIRVFGNIFLTYNFNDNHSLSIRSTADSFSENTFNGQNRGGTVAELTGFLNTQQNTSLILDNTLQYTGNFDFNENNNLQLIVGATSRYSSFEAFSQQSTNQLVFGVLKQFNFVDQAATQVEQVENILGLFTDATYSFNDYLYLNGSVRNDFTSTLEAENNSILYTGASVSFIPTDAFEGLKGDFLNYFKARFGYGSSAGFPTPYATRNVLGSTPRGFIDQAGNVIAFNNGANRLGNPDLKPERIDELEVGLDFRLFNRIGLNVSAFKRTTNDLITDRALDPATGFTVTRINAGQLENEGIEIDLDLDIIKSVEADGFRWGIRGNFYADEPIVTELPDGVDQIAIPGSQVFANGLANFAIAGQPYGVIQGIAIQRDDEGNRIVNPADGLYLENPDISIIGDPNPDWVSTVSNSFSYKNFTLGFDFQYRHGGDIYGTTASTLLGRGAIDIGVSRDATFILPGVLPSGAPNNLVLTSSELGFSVNGTTDELRIYDGTTIRLNLVSLSYKMPRRLLDKTPFGDITFTLSGQNLWYDAVNFPDGSNYDTNSSSLGVSNGFGIDYQAGPTARRYGFAVNLSF